MLPSMELLQHVLAYAGLAREPQRKFILWAKAMSVTKSPAIYLKNTFYSRQLKLFRNHSLLILTYHPSHKMLMI